MTKHFLFNSGGPQQNKSIESSVLESHRKKHFDDSATSQLRRRSIFLADLRNKLFSYVADQCIVDVKYC